MLAATLVSSSLNSTTGIEIQGDAYHATNRIELTPLAQNRQGSVTVQGTGDRSLNKYGRAVEFDFQSTVSLRDSTTQKPGDGLAFHYGVRPSGGWSEAPISSGLTVSIDTYLGLYNANGRLLVYYNGQELARWTRPVDSYRGFSKLFRVEMKSDSTMRLYHPAIGTKSVPIPGYNPTTEWKFGVGARTSSSVDRHVLQDLKIINETEQQAPQVTLSVTNASISEQGSMSIRYSVRDLNGNTSSLRHELLNANLQPLATLRTVTSFPKDGGQTFYTDTLSAAQIMSVTGRPGVFFSRVTAVDKLGNTQEQIKVIQVFDDDIAPPSIVVTPSESSSVTTTSEDQRFEWEITDASGVHASVIITKDGEEIFQQEYDSGSPHVGAFDVNSFGIGEFQISIQAEDLDSDRIGDSLTSSVTRTVTVLNSPPVPVIDVRTVTDDWKEGSSIEFSAAQTIDYDGDPLTYVWTFGDNPTRSFRGETIVHAFQNDGLQTVTLTVVDGANDAVSTSQSLIIEDVLPTAIVQGLPTEIAEFTPLEISVLIVDPGDDAYSVVVDWGDETIDEYESGSVSHSYTTGGMLHPVRIYARDATGDTLVHESSITVHEAAPRITGLPSLLTGAPDDSIEMDVNLENTDLGLAHFRWEFSDGQIFEGLGLSSISPSFAVDGLVGLSLSVTDPAIPNDVGTATATVSIGTPVSFTASEWTVHEDANSVSVFAELESGQAATSPISIPLILADPTRHADDIASVGSIEFGVGDLIGVGVIQITDDLLNEDLESIEIQLGAAGGTSHGAIDRARINVIDNDALPRVTLLSSGGVVDELTQLITVTAKLSETSGRDVHVPVAFSGSATVGAAGADYRLVGQPTISIPAGEQTGTIEFEILDDFSPESAEQVIVSLGQSDQAETLAGPGEHITATYVIAQNDQPEITLDSVYRLTSEGVSRLALTARLTSISDATVTVDYTISGTATPGIDYVLSTGTLTFPPGTLTTDIVVLINDDEIVEDVEDIVVSLDNSSNAFASPTTTIVTDILDNDVARVSLQTADLTRWEGEVAVFSLSLDRPVEAAIAVPVHITGSAGLTAGDFADSAINTIVVFAAGETSQEFRLETTDDSHNETVENVFLELGEPVLVDDSIDSKVILGGSRTASLSVLDNDPLLTFRPEDFQIAEGSSGATINVLLSAPTNRNITSHYRLSGTARQGADYQGATTRSVVIPAGKTEGQFTISLVDDLEPEPVELLEVSFLQGNGGGFRGDQRLQLAIIDNDTLPRVTWRREQTRILENAGAAEIELRLARAIQQSVTVKLKYHDADAIRDTDYRRGLLQVVFQPGETRKTISIPIIDNAEYDPTRAFLVSVAGVTNAIPPGDSPNQLLTAVVIQNDDPPPPPPKPPKRTFWEGFVEVVTNTPAELGRVWDSFGSGKDFSNYWKNAGRRWNEEILRPENTDEFLTVASIAANVISPGTGTILMTSTLAHMNNRYPSETSLWETGAASEHFTQNPVGALGELAAANLKAVVINELSQAGKAALRNADVNYTPVRALNSGLKFMVDSADLWVGATVEMTSNWLIEKIGEVLPSSSRLLAESYPNGDPRQDLSNVDFVFDFARQQYAEKKTSLGSVREAFVFFDQDFSFTHSPGEPIGITEEDGTVIVLGMGVADLDDSGDLDASEGQWVSLAGVDTSTDVPVLLPVVAPAGFNVLTPSSTLVSALLAGGAFPNDDAGVVAAERRFLEAFDLNRLPMIDFDFASGSAVGSEPAAALFAVDTMIVDTVTAITHLFSSASTSTSTSVLGRQVYQDLADKITLPDASMDLTKPTVVSSIIDGVAIRTGIDLPADVVAAAAVAIASTNELINATDIPAGLERHERIVQIQQLTQSADDGGLSANLRAIADGTMDITEFQTLTSTASLQSRSENATIGNVLPVEVLVTNSFATEGDAEDGYMTFYVHPVAIGNMNAPLEVTYSTQDQSAVAGVDYTATSGTLRWEAGDTSAKTVQVPIADDTELESTETFLFVIDSVTNGIINENIAFGYVMDNEIAEFHLEDSGQELSVSIDFDGITVVRDGEVVSFGQLNPTSSISVSGGISDKLLLFADEAVEFELVSSSDAVRIIRVDDFEIRIEGDIALEADFLPILEIPEVVSSTAATVLSASVPLGFNPEHSEVTWRVHANGEVIATGASMDFPWTPQGYGFATVEVRFMDSVRVTTVFKSIEINRIPVALPSIISLHEDESRTLVLSDFGFVDLDTGDELSSVRFDALPDPQLGILMIQGEPDVASPLQIGQLVSTDQIEAGRLIFSPAADMYGMSFGTFSVSDGKAFSDSATFEILVSSVNDAPVVDFLETSISVLEHDRAINAGTFGDVDATDTVSLTASIGSVVGNANGTWTWSWDTSDGPTDSQNVTITAFDGLVSTSEYFELNVLNVPPTPTIESISAPSIEGTKVVVVASAFDPGRSNDTLTYEYTVIKDGQAYASASDVDLTAFSFTPDDNGSYQINLTVSDEDGGSSTVSETIAVLNALPKISELTTDSPLLESPSMDSIVALTGTFSDVGVLDTHSVVVDWGDGNTSSAYIDPLAGTFEAGHVYASGGFFAIVVTLSDNDGGLVSDSTTAAVQGVGIVDEVLWVVGTNVKDKVKIDRKSRGGGQNREEYLDVDARLDRDRFQAEIDSTLISSIHIVTLDGKDDIDLKNDVGIPVSIDSGAGDDKVDVKSGRAIVYAGPGRDKVITADGDDFVDGGSGDDDIKTGEGNDVIVDRSGDNKIDAGAGDDEVTVGDGRDEVDLGDGDDSAWLGGGDDKADGGDGDDLIFGEAGDDRIDGDKGNDVIIGGDGDDRIDGDRGIDVLIGGFGADQIDGGRDDDLLIAGWTSYDNDLQALQRVMMEWSSEQDYRSRVENLRTGSGGNLAGSQLTAGETVFDDGVEDRIDGQDGRDWFFGSIEDEIKRGHANELLDML